MFEAPVIELAATLITGVPAIASPNVVGAFTIVLEALASRAKFVVEGVTLVLYNAPYNAVESGLNVNPVTPEPNTIVGVVEPPDTVRVAAAAVKPTSVVENTVLVGVEDIEKFPTATTSTEAQ